MLHNIRNCITHGGLKQVGVIFFPAFPGKKQLQHIARTRQTPNVGGKNTVSTASHIIINFRPLVDGRIVCGLAQIFKSEPNSPNDEFLSRIAVCPA